ncbi:hypothetical protein OE88DRAFT_1737846 [Heliocybe sulcata]|uniref:Uncharacterized protein n=1 Tax=Heliocybe sulcata TaxID=5364 RepID=A0A5C3MWK5_9AGAM|nr:hypothetical protein OE88DRAFT_1737846 [Heliocybe sulcata]
MASTAAVFTLRAYAVYSKSRLVLACLGTLGAVCVALDITHVPGLRCAGSSSIPIANELLSILMVVFEFSSAILTTVRSVQALKGNGLTWKEQKTSFFYLILEQGMVFYTFGEHPAYLHEVILNFRTTGFLQRLLNALILPVSGLLTARFILHLKQWERNSDAAVSGSKSSPGNHELSEFEAVQRTMTSLVDDFGEDPVARERNRDALAFELRAHEASTSHTGDEDEVHGEKILSVREGKQREVV